MFAPLLRTCPGTIIGMTSLDRSNDRAPPDSAQIQPDKNRCGSYPPGTGLAARRNRLPAGLQVCLQITGARVAYNHPYKGLELVRRFTDPARHCHSIQPEINRKLYMNGKTFELHVGYESLKANLRSLVELLLQTDPCKL